jgi:hypothetical protein
MDEGGNQLDVYMADGEITDVRLNGESVWPSWFKIEWKGNGELSAKIQGVRIATSRGDAIRIHQGAPVDRRPAAR